MKTSIKRRASLALIGAGIGTVASALLARKLWAGRPQITHLRQADDNDLDDLSDLKPVVPPRQAPNVAFGMADGTVKHLADFRGHGMVVNLWATWCRPCVAEMPALAKLSAALAPADVAVMPLSDDRGGVPVVRRFFDEHGITALPILTDQSGDAARAFDIRGYPTTIIIDRQGREQARLEGAADWSSESAVALVAKLALS